MFALTTPRGGSVLRDSGATLHENWTNKLVSGEIGYRYTY